MKGSFYTTEQLGPKRSLTPEGFLLCEDVPLARTGMMIYGPDETPVDAGPDGLVKIFRDPEEVFRPETLASLLGKPVTNDHPDEDVTPDNWKELALGTAINIRRGEGAYDDLVLGDLLITDKEGIKEILENNKIEISLGYDADYEEVRPGVGRQLNIICNHIALVDQGRCGPRCAVNDHSPKEKAMPKYSRITEAVSKGVKDALRKGKGKDEDLPPHAEPGDVHVHVHGGEVAPTPVSGAGTGDEGGEELGSRVQFTDDDIQEHMDKNEAEHAEMRARIEALEKLIAGQAGAGTGDEGEGYEEGKASDNEAIEGALKEEAPEGTSDEEIKMTKDSSLLVDSYKDTIGLAEILVPGIRVPTFDRSAKPGQSFKKICGLRRQALDLAYNQPATRSILDELLAGKTLNTKQMTCDAVRTLFRSAAAIKKTANNNAGRTGDMGGYAQATGPLSLTELNKKNASYWANH
jgi:hypothetical protein